MTPDQISYLRTLSPPDPAWLGTGSLPLFERPADHPITLIRKVAAMAAAGAPDTADLSGLFVGQSYNQGASGACVAASEAGLCSMDDYAQDHQWTVYDWQAIYHRAGGTGSNGVETRLCLQQAIDLGVPVLGGGSQKVIQSYLFVPQVPGQFRETLKAAIAAGVPCTLALLLPTNFSWESSGAVSTGYHQVVACSYDSRWCGIKNSWGDGWGHNGFGRIEWDYLEANGLQQKFCYAYTVQSSGVLPVPTPVPIPIPVPTPTPTPSPSRITVLTATTTAGPEKFAKGQVLTLGNVAATLTVSNVESIEVMPLPDPHPTPDPLPDPLPDPNPTPHPGAIRVETTPAGLFTTVRLADPATGAYLGGVVSATLNGLPYPVARPRTTPAVSALLRQPVAGAIIHGKADDGREGDTTL